MQKVETRLVNTKEQGLYLFSNTAFQVRPTSPFSFQRKMHKVSFAFGVVVVMQWVKAMFSLPASVYACSGPHHLGIA